MENNYENKWKRQHSEDDDHMTNGVDRTSPDSKRMRTKSIDLPFGHPDEIRVKDHARYMNILMRLFPEQKKNVLELILKGCGGDLVQTIECVLPSHEEARVRGSMVFPGLQHVHLLPPPHVALRNGMSAFSPFPQGPRPSFQLSPTEITSPQPCAGPKCPSCIYYPGIGPVHIPISPTHVRNLSPRSPRNIELPIRRISMSSDDRPPSTEQKVPLASLTKESTMSPEELRDCQRIRSATDALISMSAGPVHSVERSSVIRDNSSTEGGSPRNSPRHSSTRSTSPSC